MESLSQKVFVRLVRTSGSWSESADWSVPMCASWSWWVESSLLPEFCWLQSFCAESVATCNCDDCDSVSFKGWLDWLLSFGRRVYDVSNLVLVSFLTTVLVLVSLSLRLLVANMHTQQMTMVTIARGQQINKTTRTTTTIMIKSKKVTPVISNAWTSYKPHHRCSKNKCLNSYNVLS